MHSEASRMVHLPFFLQKFGITIVGQLADLHLHGSWSLNLTLTSGDKIEKFMSVTML